MVLGTVVLTVGFGVAATSWPGATVVAAVQTEEGCAAAAYSAEDGRRSHRSSCSRHGQTFGHEHATGVHAVHHHVAQQAAVLVDVVARLVPTTPTDRRPEPRDAQWLPDSRTGHARECRYR